MNSINRRTLTLALGLAPLVGVKAQGIGGSARPLRIIVPFGAGGGSDPAARFFGARLGEALQQPAVIENRAGGISGSIGTMAVKSAPADGHTLLVASLSPMVLNPILVRDLPYDPAKDFKPISGLTKTTNAIVVPATSPHRDLQGLVKASKGDNLNVGGSSALFQLAAMWFGSVAGLRFTYAPYKGVGQVLTDVGGGILDGAFVDMAGALPLIQAGKVRALATTGTQRHRSLPDVPTVVESGWRDFVFYSWISFHVRAETPPEQVRRLADAMKQIVHSDAARDYARTAATELFPLGPDALAKHQQEELQRFQKVADAAGMQPQ
jgi:tripartite-type tricarboxylate transporter receptor subunit TctC